MTDPDTPHAAEDEEFDGYECDDDEDDACYWCGGEGSDQCTNPLECCERHDRFGYCRCKSCGGSGLKKDMTIW